MAASNSFSSSGKPPRICCPISRTPFSFHFSGSHRPRRFPPWSVRGARRQPRRGRRGSPRRRDCTDSRPRRDFSPRTDSSRHMGFSPRRGCRDSLPRTGSSRHRDWRLPPGDAARRRPSNKSPHSRRRGRRDSRRTGCTDFLPHRDCRDSLRHTGFSRRTGWPPRKDSLPRMDSSPHTDFSPHTGSLRRTDFSPRRGWRRSVAPGSRRDSRRRAPTARPRPEVRRVSRQMTEAMI